MSSRKPRLGDAVVYRAHCNQGPTRTIVALEANTEGGAVTRANVVLESAETCRRIRRGKDDVGAVLEDGTVRVWPNERGEPRLDADEVEALESGSVPEGLVVLDPAPRHRTTLRSEDLTWSDEDDAWFPTGMMLSKEEAALYRARFGSVPGPGEDLEARRFLRQLVPAQLRPDRREWLTRRLGAEGMARLHDARTVSQEA